MFNEIILSFLGTLVGPGLGHLIRSMRTAIDDDSVMY